MKKSTKAALLSALVFPGVGHIYLKNHIPGVILAGASFVGIYAMVSTIMESALQIVEKIQSGSVEPDVAAIIELVSNQPTRTYQFDIAMVVFFICWLIGIIDSYRVGYAQDKKRTG